MHGGKSRRSRARSRGTTTGACLIGAAFLGCFLVPMIGSMNESGKRIAKQAERTDNVMLEQSR
jgi:hypothetical protein